MDGERVHPDDPRLSDRDRNIFEISGLAIWLGLRNMAALLPSIDSYKTKVAQIAASAFEKNLAVVTGIGEMLDRTWLTATLFNASQTAACMELFNTIQRPAVDLDRGVTRDEASAFHKQCEDVRQLQRDLLAGTKRSPYFFVSRAREQDYVDFFDANDKAKFASLMASQVILTWTAFETLAGDLWAAAINDCPYQLAKLGGNRQRISDMVAAKSDAQRQRIKDEKPEGDQGRQVDLNRIAALTQDRYDLSLKMGALLKERMKFTTLDGIREAYSEAFIKRHAPTEKIDSALSSTGLDVLGAVRNLLVHQGGVVDEEYLEASKAHADAPRAEFRKQLKLHGWTCSSLIRPVVSSALELLSGVDNHLHALTAYRKGRVGNAENADAPGTQ